MTVVSVKEQPGSPSVQSGTAGQLSVTRLYHVRTSVATDGPITVLAASGLPTDGDGYAYQSESVPSCTVRRRTPVRDKDVKTLWLVTCEYETPSSDSDKDKNNPNGSPKTDDPFEDHPRIYSNFAHFTIPVEEAELLTALPGALGRAVNSVGPVINSAGVPFVPGLEMDDPHLILIIERNENVANLNQHASFINAVNTDAFVINQQGIQYNALVGELKINDITTSGLKARKGIPFLPVRYEIHVRDNWDDNVIDRGFQAIGNVGDPDGLGGYYTDLTEGAPPLRELKDRLGNQMTVPVLFNGQGQPAANGGDVFKIRYRKYRNRRAFAPLDLPNNLP